MDSPHFELSFGDHPDDDLHWAKEKGGNNSGGRRGYYLVVLLGSFGVAKH